MKPATSPSTAMPPVVPVPMPAATVGSHDGLATRILETEGGELAYDDTGGHGQLVIALPGMGDLRQQYRYLRPYLAHAGYRVVTMDVRGQGESSVHWPDYSAHAAGRDVLALMDALQASSAIVIGNSFAAGAAAWAAQLGPQRIRGAVMIGPILRDLPMAPWMAAALKIGFMGPWRIGFWMSYWNSLFPTHQPADHALYCDTLRRTLREPGRMQALCRMIGLSKAETDAILDDTRIPCLIVMGSKDADFPAPAQEAAFLAARLDASVHMVTGAGHYPHVDMPDETATEIIAFLKTLR